MTVQPDTRTGVDMGLLDSDQNRYKGLTAGGSNSYGSYTSGFPTRKAVTLGQSGTVVKSPGTFKNNSFYMNGPWFDPMDTALSRWNAVQSRAASWSDDRKKYALETTFKLMSQYGHTNSAGTLLAIAESGLDPNSDAIKKVLDADAKVANAEYASAIPSTASSPVQETPAEAWYMTAAQFVARNAFALLSAPVEAAQGGLRTSGGILTDDELSIGEKAAKFASYNVLGGIPGVLSNLDNPDYMRERVTIDPWAQTEFGQTMAKAFTGDGVDAFTSQQAGLDVNAALEIIREDPQYSDIATDPLRQAELIPIAEQYARENNLYSNPGWFVDETSRVGEAQRQSTFNAWAIPGPDDRMVSWTLGRGIFSNIGGPDWSGYGVASGLVDAISIIGMDPLTYAGGMGVGSRILKTAGKGIERLGVEGAERALTVGKAGRQARNAIGNINRTDAKTLDNYNAIADAQDLPRMTADEWAALDLVDRADATRQLREMETRSEMIAMMTPDEKTLANQTRSYRRALAEQDRIDRVSATGGGLDDAEELRRGRDLWRDMIDSTTLASTNDGRRVLDPNRYNAWRASLTDEDVIVFNNMTRLKGSLQNQGIVDVTDFGKANDDFINYLNNASKKKPGRKKKVEEPNIEADAARAVASGQIDEIAMFDEIDLSGTIAVDFIPGQGAVGSVDNIQSMVYWAGKKLPNVRNVDDVIDAPTMETIRPLIQQLLDREEIARPGIQTLPDDADTIAGEVAERIRVLSDAREDVLSVLNFADLQYGLLLQTMSRHGLDGWLDDILRQAGTDGISGINRRTGKGVWFGDNPNVRTYVMPENALDNGAEAVKYSDPEEFLSSLSNIVVQPSGLRGVPNYRLSALKELSANNSRKLYDEMLDYDSSIVADARLKTSQLDNLIEGIRQKFDTPDNKFRAMLENEIGMVNSPLRGNTLDPQAVRWFLFGTGSGSHFANKALDALSGFVTRAERQKLQGLKRGDEEFDKFYEESIGELSRITKGKWDADTYISVVDNAVAGGGRDGLLKVLAPRLGIDVSQGDISKATRLIDTDGNRQLRTWRVLSPEVKRRIARMVGQYPNARKVQLDNPYEVAENLDLYGRYARIDEKEIDRLIGKVLYNAGQPGATAVARNSIIDMLNMVGVKLIDNLDQSNVFKIGTGGEARKEALKKAMQDATRAYRSGTTGISSIGFYDELNAANAGVPKYIMPDGSEFVFPNLQLESEIAQGVINLPSVEDWAAANSRIGRAIGRFGKVDDVYRFGKSIYDNFFRTSLLVFRVAYILRNSAEMQVRMFLNGHKSVFNSPLTLMGMVFGNNVSNRRSSQYAQKLFGKQYSDTILGTAFEVGDDEARAAANYIEDYFAIIRQGHSLTDPRVYNNAVLRDWTPIEILKPGTDEINPNFIDGWSNELLMLHRSPLARVVSGAIPGDFPGAAQYDSVFDKTIAYLQSPDKRARQIRETLIAADEKYRVIFDDPDMLREYLFDSPNSIQNRIKVWTKDDPRLKDFVKSGTFRYSEGNYYSAASIDLNKRVSDLSSVLRKEFFGDEARKAAMVDWFQSYRAKVPWQERIAEGRGIGAFDAFFRFTNKIEKIGSVGPEFRMAYWDRIAELAPTLRGTDVDRALNAAETTLKRIQRLGKDGQPLNIGRSHPAYRNLEKARNNPDDLLTLDDLHEEAMRYAADEVKGLFYDAANRNNFWSALRLLIPFGQAWGNTLATWGKLGAKNPVQIYKIQRAIDAMIESGSSAIYEFGEEAGIYSDYAPGSAPYDQATSGGFLYNNQYGQTNYMIPLVGRGMSIPLRMWSLASGVDVPMGALETPIESPAMSANLALGGDSIYPGLSFIASGGIELLPQDWEITSSLKNIAAPFGEKSISETAIPAWGQKLIGGAGSIPVIGRYLENFVGNLAPQGKGKYRTDAMAILATSGNYNLTNAEDVERMRNDADGLSKALLFTTGLFQNISPTTPVPTPAINFDAQDIEGMKNEMNSGMYSIISMNAMFQSYVARNAGDQTEARVELVKDFGPYALFAIVGDWKGFSRQPSSKFMDFAMDNPEIANSQEGFIELFFPGGDPSDVAARRWLEQNANKVIERKTTQEISAEVLSWMERIQLSRINFQEAEDYLSADDAAIARDEISERYKLVESPTLISTMTKTDFLERLYSITQEYPSVRNQRSAQVFLTAWELRRQALDAVRSSTGDDRATLGRKDAENVKVAYLDDINTLIAQEPDFKLIGQRMLREWD